MIGLRGSLTPGGTVVPNHAAFCADAPAAQTTNARKSVEPVRMGRLCYCLSATITLWIFWPCAFVPFWVVVRSFPPLEMTVLDVSIILPPFFVMVSMVFALMRLIEIVSALGFPVSG